MPSDSKNVKTRYPWQGSNQQSMVQSSLSTEVNNPPVDDNQFAHHHTYNQGHISNNFLYDHHHVSSSSSYPYHQIPQNLRASANGSGDSVHSTDYDSKEDKEAIIDQLIFNLNGKLTLNNNSDTYQCHSLCKERRLSPYSTTGHTAECTNYHLLNSTDTNITTDTDDPAYRLMQQLIKEGALIKEAVRRLQYTKSDSPITLC